MGKQDMLLSLNGDTFASLKADFDKLLNRTIGNMEMKGAEDATLTLKIGISLSKETVSTPEGYRDVNKPSFKHEINSVMQVKDKMTGQLKGEHAIVWDGEKECYVMRKIDNGQMNLFETEEDDDLMEVDYEEVPNAPALESGAIGLPAPEENEEDNVAEPDRSADTEEGWTPFGWLQNFIGQDLTVHQNMGNFSVRNTEGKIILSSATTPDNYWYCRRDILARHSGHSLDVYGSGDDFINTITVECMDCDEVLFTLRQTTGTVGEPDGFVEDDADQTLVEEYDGEAYDESEDEEAYEYDDPE